MDDVQVINSLDMAQVVIGLVGGLALFLHGLTQLTSALKAAAGDRLRAFLKKCTDNRFMGIFSGAAITAAVQSSSITTVLLVGFVSSGLMSLEQSIGAIMGANIGSTVTAQLIAFDVSKYALLVVALGFALSLASRDKVISRYGTAIIGIGLIFYGMVLMGDAVAPMRTYEPFLDFMKTLESPLAGVLFGTLFTAIVQSSAATTGLLIIFAAQGFVTLDAGIAIVLGANIGTCITPMLATIGNPRESLRVALVHVIFNTSGAVVWFWLIPELGNVVKAISPTFPDLTGAERLAAEAPRQIANAHTIFNVVNTVAMIWFVGPMASLMRWLVPIREQPDGAVITPKYIDDYYLTTPGEAIERLTREIVRMGKRVIVQLERASPAVVGGNKPELEAIADDEEAEVLGRAIVRYCRKLGRQDLTPKQSSQLQALIAISSYLSSVDDLIRTNLVSLGIERVNRQVSFSKETLRVLRPLYDTVARSMAWAMRALLIGDPELAHRVVLLKPEIERLASAASDHLGKRLLADEPHRVTVFRLESEIIGQTKRLYYFSKRIGKEIIAEPDLVAYSEQSPA